MHLNNDLTELEVAEKKEIKLILESVTNSIRESADIIKIIVINQPYWNLYLHEEIWLCP